MEVDDHSAAEVVDVSRDAIAIACGIEETSIGAATVLGVPFPDATVHVIQAERIRLLHANTMVEKSAAKPGLSWPVHVPVEPGILVQLRLVVSEVELGGAACTAGVFPLRLGRESERMAGRLSLRLRMNSWQSFQLSTFMALFVATASAALSFLNSSSHWCFPIIASHCDWVTSYFAM